MKSAEDNPYEAPQQAADEDRREHGPLRRVAMWVLLVLGIPGIVLGIAGVFIILLGVGLLAAAANAVSEVLFKLRMRRRNRVLSRRALGDRIAWEGAGTLVVEAPSPGWGITRAWWTADKVSSRSPIPPPSLDEYRFAIESIPFEWEQWCWEEYVNPDNGKALLLRMWNGESLGRKLKARYPALEVVWCWSARIHMPLGPIHAEQPDGREPV